MIVFFVLVVVLLIGLTTAAVMGKIGGFLADPTSSQSFGGVPAGSLSAGDVAQLHFDQGLRGYRMDQVDQVIDALSNRLTELEADVDSLRATATASPSAGASSSAPGDAQGVTHDSGRSDPLDA